MFWLLFFLPYVFACVQIHVHVLPNDRYQVKAFNNTTPICNKVTKNTCGDVHNNITINSHQWKAYVDKHVIHWQPYTLQANNGRIKIATYDC